MRAPAVIRGRAEMETLAREITALTLSRNRQLLEWEEALTMLRDRYESSLVEIEVALETKTAQAREWAEANPEEFKGMRSVELAHGVVGWRTGQPALKPIGGWTWDRVLAKLKAFPHLLTYVRAKEEVNKQALLGNREALGRETLRAIGVRVVQEESFYVEPRVGEADNRQLLAAA